jgi:anti-sigma factor RsiW
MCEDMRALLNAYLDGELSGWRLLQVQNHLASCASCREELRELRLVSDLLQAAPAPEFVPAERFVANLTLSLPRRPITSHLKRGPTLVWWLAPVALIGLWYFIQTVITLSGAVSLVAQSGLLAKGTAWLSTGSQHTAWFSAVTDLFHGQAGTGTASTLSIADQVTLLGNSLLNQLFWQAVVALLYWVWMAAWWLRTRGRMAFGTLVQHHRA